MRTRSQKDVAGSRSLLWPCSLLPLVLPWEFCKEPDWFAVQAPAGSGGASGAGTPASWPHWLLPPAAPAAPACTHLAYREQNSRSAGGMRDAGCGSLSHAVRRFWSLPRMRASRVLTGLVPVSGRPSSVQSCPFGSCVTCVSDSLSTDLNIRFPRGCIVTEAEQNL